MSSGQTRVTSCNNFEFFKNTVEIDEEICQGTNHRIEVHHGGKDTETTAVLLADMFLSTAIPHVQSPSTAKLFS